MASGSSISTGSLFNCEIDMFWPSGMTRGAGMKNNGNTCYINSVLQILLHTPPLLSILRGHKRDCE